MFLQTRKRQTHNTPYCEWFLYNIALFLVSETPNRDSDFGVRRVRQLNIY